MLRIQLNAAHLLSLGSQWHGSVMLWVQTYKRFSDAIVSN